MKRLALTAAFVVLSVPNGSAASLLTGNQLLATCTSERATDKSFCLAYIMGIADEFVLLRRVEDKPQCIPPGATAGQLMDIALALLKESPEIRHADAPFLVTASFGKAWHCQ